jgi:hypothetical protein
MLSVYWVVCNHYFTGQSRIYLQMSDRGVSTRIDPLGYNKSWSQRWDIRVIGFLGIPKGMAFGATTTMHRLSSCEGT